MIVKEANKLNLKTTILTIADMFDIEKLEKKNPDLFKELCEKYPLKGEKIYILQCVKGERLKIKEETEEEVSETPSVSQEAQETAPVEEAQPTEVVDETPTPKRVINNYGGTYVEHVEEMNIIEGEDYSQYNDVVEGPQAVIEPPLDFAPVQEKTEITNADIEMANNDSYPEDFQPLFRCGEQITIKYDYDRVVEKLTILMPMLITDDKNQPTAYKYKVMADKVGIKYYDEQFLVDNEVQQ